MEYSNLFKENEEFIKSILPFKAKTISDENFLLSINSLCIEYEESDDITWEHSKIRKVFAVFDRFKTVLSLENDYKGQGLDKEQRYVSICQYLLLTCFDQLGQNNEWLPFGSWLVSKGKKEERDSVIAKIDTKSSLDYTKEILDGYNLIYGIKKSFMRFIFVLLPKPIMGYLLDSVRVVKLPIGAKDYSEQEFLEDKYADYLYKIRNDFTHNSYSTGPVMFNEAEFYERPGAEDDAQATGWMIREELVKTTYSITYFNHSSFYERLKTSVLVGLTEYVRINGGNI